MKKIFRSKAIIGLLLVLSLLFSSAAPAFSANAAEPVKGSQGYRFEKIDDSAIKGTHIVDGRVVRDGAAYTMKATDEVRVSIVLEGDSVIEAGFSTENIASNQEALSFITKVKKQQKSMEKKISSAIKSELKVQWNLAVAANIISADVKYGDLEKIANVDGVKQVVVETQYEPYSKRISDDPNMAISTGYMTGAQQAWAEGQTGAGGRIAIIDTGLDIDHISFNNNAYLYALAQNAAEAGLSVDEYMESLELLDAEAIAQVLPNLNAYARRNGKLTAEELVVSAKIPYGFNYVDRNLNVRHIYDSQGEHGSHVAGIATANRFLEVAAGEFADALETVYVAGNAPDAQIMVMKVFGAGGGAYDSDYMAAIEDAILLGADSVNLSLGSGNAGFTTNATYQSLLDKLATTDTVVVMSAGNSGQWADNTTNGYLYGDDVNFDTAGSPGSYTNALTVASVDNIGSVGHGFQIGDTVYGYNESATYGNAPMVSLITVGESSELDYVFIDGVGVEEDYAGIDVAGKIVFVSRGATSFFEKANIAASKGALATIIYNNTTGTIGLNLTGYEYEAPCVSIYQSDAQEIREASEAVTTAEGNTYYTGKITLYKNAMAILSKAKNYTISSFSSWGVHGDLGIKPEISAPGGSIWSVNGTNNAGGGFDQYELMSGTSMAAPQVTGMMAVLKRYIETATGKTFPELTDRAIAQSLLMSTATPMVDADGCFYPVFQQGAGLANVADAMNAASIIIMNENATASATDGKVKAELGDDADRTGVYSFGFTLQNLTSEKHSYTFDDAIFTQYLTQGFLLGETDFLDADVTFTVNGKNVSIAPVNPYQASLDAAQAAFDKAVAAYNDAKEAVLVANAEAAKGAEALAKATAELAAAKAKVTAAQVAEKLAKAAKKVNPKGYEAAQKALKDAQEAEKTADKNLKTVTKSVSGLDKNIQTAIKAETKAAAELAKAETKLTATALKYKCWKAPYDVNTVILNAGEAAEVTVTIELTDDTKAFLDANYVNGAYVEGYIFLDSTDDTASHSIPVLAYYGNWSDPSMFDKGSVIEYMYGFEDRDPYLYAENDIYGNAFTVVLTDENGEFYYGGNIFADETAEQYSPFHNALNNQKGDYIKSAYLTLIRNAANSAVIIADYDTHEVYSAGTLGSITGAYYYVNGAKWMNTQTSVGINWYGTDAEGKALPEGTRVVISVVAAPEYSAKVGGDIDFASLGSGAYFSTVLTIDNTAPEILSVESYNDYFDKESEDGKDGLILEAVDNENIAAVELYAAGGSKFIASGAVAENGFYHILAKDLDPDVYVIRVIDYAGNASAYRVFLNVEPSEDVESIELDATALRMVKNNIAKLTATVSPSTLLDTSVIWSSSDEAVATVDANGIVTAVGVGTCDIYATSVMDDAFTATCNVEVIEINTNLNGVVWDESGEVWFSEINTASLPEYKKLTSASTNAPIAGLAYGADGKLYASSIDTSADTSTLYLVDQDTYELSLIGESEISYSDIAEAPNLTGLIGVYYNYVVLIDPSTGDYLGAFNFGNVTLVGITYVGSQYMTQYRAYRDLYYVLDTNGNIYLAAYMPYNGNYGSFYNATSGKMGSTGIACDVSYFQSLYFDGEYTFVSNFVESRNNVVLYAIDTENTGAIYKLGTFADGVWPVAALTEFGVGTSQNAVSDNFRSSEVLGVATNVIDK